MQIERGSKGENVLEESVLEGSVVSAVDQRAGSKAARVLEEIS